jgi:membrane protein DedA with SNARE-associated domain
VAREYHFLIKRQVDPKPAWYTRGEMDLVSLPFDALPLEDIGYLAIFLIMILDGANVPFTPNELFLGFTGYLARTGEVNPVMAYGVGLLGSLTGHAISFIVGWKLGRPLFEKYGKFIFITNKRIHETERAVKKFGPTAPFVTRFIPGLRNIGSLIFGILRYPFGSFALLSATGIAIYNALFFLTGYILGERFAELKEFLFPLIVIIIAVGLALAAVSWYRTHRSHQTKTKPTKRRKRISKRRGLVKP